MTGRWQVKWGRQKEDTSELSMKMSLDMALKNFIVPLQSFQSFQVKKKKKKLCPLVAVQCVNLLLIQAALHFVFGKKHHFYKNTQETNSSFNVVTS